MDKVVIYGTGRHAELIAHEMKRNNLHDVVAFTVKKKYLNKKEFSGRPVVCYEDLLFKYPPDKFKIFIAIGPQYVNRAREEIFHDSKERGYSFVNCLWPIPDFPEDLIIGKNVYISQGSMISNFVEIGDNVTIIGSKIGHHCKLNNNSFISGSILAGNVNVEDNVFIGLGCSIGPNITLGHHTVLGLGCVLSKSTEPASVYLNKSTEKQSFDSFKLKIF